MAQGVDWETVKAEYEEITEEIHQYYPKESGDVSIKDYPNIARPTELSKERIVTRLAPCFEKLLIREEEVGVKEWYLLC